MRKALKKSRSVLAWQAVFLMGIAFSSAGCATTGSSLSLDPVRAELQAKALRFRYQQTVRIARVGYQILTHLPEQPPRKLPGLEPEVKPRPYHGFLFADMDPLHARAFNLPEGKSVVIVGIVPGTPAEKSGILQGDMVVSLNQKPIGRTKEIESVMKDLHPGEDLEVTVSRGENRVAAHVTLASVPLPIVFVASEGEAVNAAMSANGTMWVTYGLLRFATSDDELAMVIGHELAHLTQGHMTKSLGNSIMAAVVGGVIGGLIEGAAPGVGRPVAQAVTQGVQSGYSQQNEFRADEVGLRYMHTAGFNAAAGPKLWERFAIELPSSMVQAYFATHPTSPDRFGRLKEAARSLGGPTDEDALSRSIETVQGLPLVVAPSAAPTPSVFLQEIDALLAEETQPLSVQDQNPSPLTVRYPADRISEAHAKMLRSGISEKTAGAMAGFDTADASGAFFPVTTEELFWRAEFPNLTFIKHADFLVDWYGPDGKRLYEGKGGTTLANPAHCRAKLPLSQLPQPLPEGIWTVEVSWKNKLLDEQPFVIGSWAPEDRHALVKHHLRIAVQARREKNPRAAMNAVRIAAAALPEFAPRLRLILGMLEVEHRDFTTALIQLESVKEMFRNDIRLYYALAESHRGLKQWTQAEQALQQAAQIGPQRAETSVYMEALVSDRGQSS